MSAEGFFPIGKPQWAAACKLGLNPAAAFLVLARGTGRDNVTTGWSAQAVQTYTGMSWGRARVALAALEGDPAIINSVAPHGKLRTRKLVIAEDAAERLWLPNALVTGARDETPPVAKLRQTQCLENLQMFIELYGVQDLAGDGGLPRPLLSAPFARRRICERGPFVVYGFTRTESCVCARTLPFDELDGSGSGADPWERLSVLQDMGLLERVDYLAESDSPDAELLHALTGDDEARAVADAAMEFAMQLPSGFSHEAERFDYTLPVLRHIANPAVVGVFRLVYRPHTRLTAA